MLTFAIYRALEILTELFSSDAVNGALVTYFERKDIIAKLIEIVSDGIDKDRNQCVASQKQLLAASLLIESIQVRVIYLFSARLSNNGYAY